MKNYITNAVFIVLLAIFFTSCSDDGKESVDPVINASDLALSVSYEPVFDNTVYPSIILGLSKVVGQVGASFEFIEYSFTSPKENATLKIVLAASDVNEETVWQATLGTKGAQETATPTINWDHSKLRAMSAPGNTNLKFTAYLDGEEIDNKSITVNYRSVNECVYGINDNGAFMNLNFMFAAYVNEEHTKIDGLLQEGLNTGLVDDYSGFQGTENDVINEVFSLWYLLQSKGIKYSSITDTSAPSDKVMKQYVRMFDEVIDNTQANCVDGSVFISSILKKISIAPFIVLVPGHMYMGYYTSSDRSNYYLLETTMMGDVDLRTISTADDLLPYKQQLFLTQETYDAVIAGTATIEYAKAEISWYSFVAASNNNDEDFNNAIDSFNDDTKPNYQVFDIEELRVLVQPIGE